jgi:hypothetical protein
MMAARRNARFWKTIVEVGPELKVIVRSGITFT